MDGEQFVFVSFNGRAGVGTQLCCTASGISWQTASFPDSVGGWNEARGQTVIVAVAALLLSTTLVWQTQPSLVSSPDLPSMLF